MGVERAAFGICRLESMGTETSSACQPGHKDWPSLPEDVTLAAFSIRRWCLFLHALHSLSLGTCLQMKCSMMVACLCSEPGLQRHLSSLRTPHPRGEARLVCWTRRGHRTRHGHPTEATRVQPHCQPGNSLQTQGMAPDKHPAELSPKPPVHRIQSEINACLRMVCEVSKTHGLISAIQIHDPHLSAPNTRWVLFL